MRGHFRSAALPGLHGGERHRVCGQMYAAARPGLRVRFESARAEDRSTVVEETVIRVVARILGMQDRSILPDRKFMEMGMDSLMASEMRNGTTPLNVSAIGTSRARLLMR
mgnify:CR=1 FL=1